MISKYRSSFSETDRIRHKSLKKLVVRVKDAIKSGKIRMLVSGMVKSGLSRQPSTNVNEELVMMMDQVVSSNETTTELNLIDSPVSGVTLIPPIFSKGSSSSRMAPPQVYPPKASQIRIKENGTRLTTRLFDMSFGKLIPSKWSIVFWIVAVLGTLLIVLGALG